MNASAEVSMEKCSIDVAGQVIKPQTLTLVELAQSDIDRIVRDVPGGTINVKDIYPLTPLQEGMLFHHLLNENSDTYVVSTLLELESSSLATALADALQKVIDSHDILRAAVLWEKLPRPIQVVLHRAPLPVDEVTLDPNVEPLEQLRARMCPQQQKWDLSRAPLVRLLIAQHRAGGPCYALIQLHHVICDHGSLKMVVAQSIAHLEGRFNEPPAPGAYHDHVAQALANADNRRSEDYFRRKLGEVDEPTAPFGLFDVHGDGSRIEESQSLLDPVLSQRVRATAGRLGVSAARLFHAAWALVLARTSGRSTVVFGTALLATRQSPTSSSHIFGMSVNTLPLCLRLEGLDAGELVEHTRQELDELLLHSEASLVMAQHCSGMASSTPLFSTLFAYRYSVPSAESEWSSAPGIKVLTANQYRTNYPVSLTVDNLGDGFAIIAQADRSLEARSFAGYLQKALTSLVEALDHAPRTLALALPVLPEREYRRVVLDFNDTHAAYPKEKMIQDLFEAQVDHAPEEIAVDCDQGRVTYAELNGRANQLAHYLRELGAGLGEYVPILLPRGLRMLVAQLAVLKLGGAYVPIDPTLPLQRQLLLLRDVGARRIISDQPMCVEFAGEALEWIDCSESADEIGRGSCKNPSIQCALPWPAYVMYTSGSTGVPRGVIVSHHSVIRLVINNGYARIDPSDCVVHCSNTAFDASTFEIWGALLNRARVLIVPHSVLLDSVRFARLLQERGATVLWLTAGLLTQYAAALADTFGQLRYLLTGGDIVDPVTVGRLLRGRPPQRVLNGYGPTECTTFSAVHPIVSLEPDAKAIPIGRPIANTRIYILNTLLQPVPIGVPGEVHVGGDGVAQGYLNRPELTAEMFLPDPFCGESAARLYKTGDMAKWRADGTIDFLGRNDFQIKIRGFRIEPGEVEGLLRRCEGVKHAVVLAREDSPADKRLVAYVVADVPLLKEIEQRQAGDAGAELVGQWKDLYEDTYASGGEGPTFVGWRSSYTDQPIPENQMQEWLECTLARIRALSPNKVLEIGCGVGLLLSHLAPKCEVYRGTDFSQEAIQLLRNWLATREEFRHVQLEWALASEVHGQPRSYDTVILNSVVQYFPDLGYLRSVLRRAVELVAAGGRIFVGDVRNLQLLEPFHASVQIEKAGSGLSVRHIKARVAQAAEFDKELVIDPRFFADLPKDLPRISDVTIQIKRGESDNELTRYRYDVVLEVDGTPPRLPDEQVGWRDFEGSAADMVLAMRARKVSSVRIHNVPNRRLYQDLAAARVLGSTEESAGIERIREFLSEQPAYGEDPETFWHAGEEHGYVTHVGWTLESDSGCYDVEWVDKTRLKELGARDQKRIPTWDSATLATDRQEPYSNDPLGKRLERELAQRLRKQAELALPAFMVPSAFVMIPSLPLTVNGKVDRQALPEPGVGAAGEDEYVAPQGETEEMLATIWRQLLQLDRVGRKDNFFELGGHSLMVMQMMERLHDAGCSLSMRAVFECETLVDLAENLTRHVGEKSIVPDVMIPVGCERIEPSMLGQVSLTRPEIDGIVRSVIGGTTNIKDIYPLAPLQEGLLFHNLVNEHAGDAYTLPILLAASSRDGVSRFVAALQAVMDRHDVLRTAVLWKGLPQPVQVVYRSAALPIEEIALAPDRDPIEQLKERLRPERRVFQLERAPLIRLEVASDATRHGWYVIVYLHLLVCDHESVEMMFREVIAHLRGEAPDLSEPTQYRTHVEQVLLQAQSQDAKSIFRRKLGDVSETTAPFGVSGIYRDGSQMREAFEELDSTLALRVRDRARQWGVSAATLFHAAWALVVARTSGRDDPVFGTVLLGRLQSRGRQSLGIFINTLPLRLRLQKVTVAELVEQTQRELAELLDLEQSSLADAQRCSKLAPPAPLFTALLNYRHSPRNPDVQWAESDDFRVLALRGWTNYPITLSVDDLGDGFSLTAQTDTSIDPQRLTAYLSIAVRSVVDALETAQQTPVLELRIVPECERYRPFGTQAALTKELIHELFEEQAKRSADSIAVVCQGKQLTYAELDAKSNQIARRLREVGVVADQLVAICAECSLDIVCVLLGILKTGAAYVPLDPTWPTARLKDVLEDAEPRAVLVQDRFRAVFSRVLPEPYAIESVLFEATSRAATSLPIAEVRATPESLVYVIFTSGTTGRPKGVEMPHRSVVNLIEWQRQNLNSAQPQRALQFAALPFDVAFQEIFSALCGGDMLIVSDEVARKDSKALMELLIKHSIHRVVLPPAMLRSLAVSCQAAGTIPSSLRDVICTGEPLRINAEIRSLFGKLPGCRLHNQYGPTETHVATAATFAGSVDEWPDSPPIGLPISNARILLLDTDGRPVPLGVRGEIHIGGAGLARGYLKQPELTAQRFIRDPFEDAPGSRLYRSGDIGRYGADGMIEYLGRTDDQVKIRGHRVELGAVQAELLRHENVKEAVVIAREEALDEKQMVAYVVLRSVQGTDHPFGVEALRAYVRTRVAGYEVPTAFVILDHLPWTPHGKIDVEALPVPQRSAYVVVEYEDPQGATEQALAVLWQQLLHVPRVGRHDNFFDLGGTSLIAMRLAARVPALSVAAVFEYVSLQSMAATIERAAPEAADLSAWKITEFQEGTI